MPVGYRSEEPGADSSSQITGLIIRTFAHTLCHDGYVGAWKQSTESSDAYSASNRHSPAYTVDCTDMHWHSIASACHSQAGRLTSNVAGLQQGLISVRNVRTSRCNGGRTWGCHVSGCEELFAYVFSAAEAGRRIRELRPVRYGAHAASVSSVRPQGGATSADYKRSSSSC